MKKIHNAASLKAIILTLITLCGAGTSAAQTASDSIAARRDARGDSLTNIVIDLNSRKGADKENGRFIWVPESKQAEVNTVLGRKPQRGAKRATQAAQGNGANPASRPGTPTASRSGKELPYYANGPMDFPRKHVKRNLPGDTVPGADITELVTFKGDTIPMVIKDLNYGRYNRGLFNYLFIPRKSWMFGFSFSYGEFGTSDLEVLDLVGDVDINANAISIKPYVSYFFRNNMSLGIRFNYTRMKANIDSFKVDIDEDMNFNLHDIGYNNNSYTTAVVFNQFFGIARKGRFAVTNEVALSFGMGNSDFKRPIGGEIKETKTNYQEVKLTFSPGVSVLVMENVSFNVSLGIFGFHLKNENQSVDGVELGNRLTSGANFKFNIFNISLGLGIHI